MTSETARPTSRTALRLVIMVLAFGLTAVLTVSACRLLDPEPLPAPGPRPVTQDTLSAVSKGARLYAQQCATCHGDSALGLPARGPGVQGAKNIAELVRGGRGDMPAYSSLTDAEIAQIELFLARFVAPADGAGLYSAQCARCHGDHAQGISGKGPAIQSEEGIRTVVLSGRGDMPAFPSLTPAEIGLLEQYLATFALPVDGPGLYSRYCARCHGYSAEGGANGPGLAALAPAAYPRVDISAWSAVSQGTYTMARLPDLTQAQATLVQSWLAGLPAPSTGRDLYFRYCTQCHGATGRGTARCREGVRGKSGEVYGAVRYGKESMPSYPMISSAGIGLLQSYIGSMP